MGEKALSGKKPTSQKTQQKAVKEIIKRKELTFPTFLLQTKNQNVTESDDTILCMTK
jgi:hypothetical protein